jgi:hypothetical protein
VRWFAPSTTRSSAGGPIVAAIDKQLSIAR